MIFDAQPSHAPASQDTLLMNEPLEAQPERSPPAGSQPLEPRPASRLVVRAPPTAAPAQPADGTALPNLVVLDLATPPAASVAPCAALLLGRVAQAMLPRRASSLAPHRRTRC